ncbi:MAG TPA: hypothetical protein VIX73_02975 [Kofleriaceae bacterium]|jgi:hypothetical protein
MLEHKPGKGTSKHDHDHGHAHHAGAQPGKQTRVENELGGGGGGGPLAHAADVPTGEITTSEFIAFNSGNVHVSESVAATLSHGEGPLKINLHKGGMTVGNEHFDVDFKSADAVTGKGLRVSGASVEVHHGHTTRTGAKIEDGYVGVDYSTSWTIKGSGKHPWKTTISISAFVGARPPHHHHKHWWQHIPVVSTVVAAAAAAIAAAAAAIIASSPEWGPVVVVALA